MVKGEDFDFYRHSYGAVDAMTSFDNLHETIMYYRIYESGNDYLRYLLYNFASYQDAQVEAKEKVEPKSPRSGTPAVNHQPLYCEPDDCVHPRVHKISGANLKNIFYSPRAVRFPFTFVRHPILRFISAVKEVRK